VVDSISGCLDLYFALSHGHFARLTILVAQRRYCLLSARLGSRFFVDPMASSDPWLDFEVCILVQSKASSRRSNFNRHHQFQRHRIRTHTVDRLKHIVTGFNEECYISLAKSGRKQDLIDRITQQLDWWKSQNLIDRWNKGRTVLNQVTDTGS
jgi:hypothetical protein